MTIAKIPKLYHFTDRRNLTSIRELGGLYSLTKLNEMGVEITAPGCNDWSHDGDACKGVDQFVHLCFRNTHPMEFRAREAGRIGFDFSSCSSRVLELEGVMFTSDVSNKAGITLRYHRATIAASLRLAFRLLALLKKEGENKFYDYPFIIHSIFSQYFQLNTNRSS